jgi:hypothetical protein
MRDRVQGLRNLSLTLRRAVATSGAIFLVAVGAVALEVQTASAGGCAHGVLCGAVKNRTDKTMSVTLDLGDGGGWCDVWNWSGDYRDNFQHKPCDQITARNGTLGGNGTGVDVDAFTFANQGYHERFTRLGIWHWRVKGVWTKIQDGEIADCGIGDGNQIWCTVLAQAPLPPDKRASQSLHGCALGAVCVYPQNQGWNGDRPSLVLYYYGYHNLNNQYGTHRILNNQWGGGKVFECTGYGGGGTWVAGYNPGGWGDDNLTPVNSIVLTRPKFVPSGDCPSA